MKLKYKIILGMFSCIIIIIYWFSTITQGEYYRRHSPDGQYSIYASRNKYFNLNIPFVKFSDAGGKIHLYDELENKLVGSSSIDMISNINELFWSEEELYSKGSMSNIKLPRNINPKIINEYNKSFPVKYTWKLFTQGKQYIIDKLAHRRLKVSDEKGKVVLENIEFISQINNGFQALNNNTEIEYYNTELNKLKKVPDTKIKYHEVCGNVTTYAPKIEETEKYYIFKKAVGFTDYNFNNYKSIDSIRKDKVREIYFLNKKRELKYDDNIIEKELVIIDFGTYFGILSEQYGIQYFDSIDLSKNLIKVMRNNLYGYYDITAPIYLELEPFEFNLAKFKKRGPSGEIMIGYVDKEGNNYYK